MVPIYGVGRVMEGFTIPIASHDKTTNVLIPQRAARSKQRTVAFSSYSTGNGSPCNLKKLSLSQ